MFRHYDSAVSTASETGAITVAERFRSVDRRGVFSVFTANAFKIKATLKLDYSQWTLV